MKPVAIILIIVGLILTAYTTFSFFTKDKVMDIGQVEITKKEKHSISWSPIVGVILLGAGGVMLWKAGKT